MLVEAAQSFPGNWAAAKVLQTVGTRYLYHLASSKLVHGDSTCLLACASVFPAPESATSGRGSAFRESLIPAPRSLSSRVSSIDIWWRLSCSSRVSFGAFLRPLELATKILDL